MKNSKLIWSLSAGFAILLLVVSLHALANANLVVHLPLLLKEAPIRQSGQVVFASARYGDLEIFRMDYDGSNVVQLTDNDSAELAPAWSPDGSRIAYASTQSGQFEVHVMDADGTNQVQLTHQGECDNPQWSPDGTRIAFAGRLEANLVVYSIPSAGGEVTVMTPPEVNAYSPYWSPDGSRIAYITYTADPIGVYAVDLDGSEPELLFGDGVIQSFAWSPDGRLLALSMLSFPSETYNIFLLDLQTNFFSILTNTDSEHQEVDWFPLGNYLIFQGYSDNQTYAEIYTMSWMGTELQNITNSPGGDYGADWTP